MVLRRSTTLCTWARERNNAVRSMVSFMATHIRPMGRSNRYRRVTRRQLLDGLFTPITLPGKPVRPTTEGAIGIRITPPRQQVGNYSSRLRPQQPFSPKIGENQPLNIDKTRPRRPMPAYLPAPESPGIGSRGQSRPSWRRECRASGRVAPRAFGAVSDHIARSLAGFNDM